MMTGCSYLANFSQFLSEMLLIPKHPTLSVDAAVFTVLVF